MDFKETGISGAVVVDLTPHSDERGFFARAWCQQEFEAHGLNPRLVQCNISFNRWKGTLRGLHFQVPPSEETKLVRCTSGAIFDVVLDLRPASPTFLKHFGVTLSAENRRGLYVPEGCAHGFQTLSDDTEVFYHMSEFFNPGAARGVRWDDAAFGIRWPHPVSVMSERDRRYPDFDPSSADLSGN